MPKTLKLLVLEDEPNDAELEIAKLEEVGYSCQWNRVDTEKDFLEHLDTGDYDIILSDYSLPNFDGLTALKLIIDRKIDLPFILVSGTLGEDAAIESLRAGAVDYVLKTRLSRLAPVVARALKEHAEHQQRQRAEEELYQNEQLLNATQAIANVGGWGYDVATETMRWTDQTYRIHEIPAGRSIDYIATGLLCYLPEDREAIEGAFRRCVEQGEAYDLELPFRTARGRDRWIRTTAKPIMQDGKIVRVIGDIMDITERKLAEESLRVSQEKLRLTIDYSPLGVCTVDSRGNFTEANPAYERITGYSLEELQKLTFSDLTHPDDRSINKTQFQNMTSGNQTGFKMEKRYIRKNGSVIFVAVHAEAIHDDDGNPLFGLAVVEDITERKQMEKERARLSRFPSENPNPVLRVSAQGVLEYANEASSAFIPTLGADVGGGVNPEWQARIDEVAATAHPVNIEVQVGGRTFSVTLAPVMDQGYVNLYASDITEAIKVEDQLRQAQKMEAIGQLVGGIAHDFNNILQTINGFAELALAKIDPQDAVCGQVTEIATAGARAAVLVKQLLTFSRRDVIFPVDLDLNEVIGAGVKMLRRTVAENIEFEFYPAHKLDNLHVDRGQIEQVLMNLCVNARDAMPDGGWLIIKTGNVSLADENEQLHPQAEPGRYVHLSITDTGFGMSKETKDQIFEPFFTTKEVGKGTGLGLSTVFGIVKQSGGYVEVESELEKGTVFNIYFPVSDSVSTEPVRRVELSAKGGTETILIAEDDVAVLTLAEHTLCAAGYTVLTAKNGEEALQLFEKYADEIGMVVFDVIMPHLGGKDAMEAILKLRPRLPHLLVSGYTGSAAHTGFIKEKKPVMLAKPYRSKELLQKIRQLLDEK